METRALISLFLCTLLAACGGSSGSSRTSVQPAIQTSTPPVITLMAPNGGEFLWGTQSITWGTTTPVPGTVEIRLSTDSGQTFPVQLAATAPDTGSFSWDTTANTDSGSYRVQVIPTDALGLAGNPDTSAGDFTVANTGLLYALEHDGPGYVAGQAPPVGNGVTPLQTISSITFGNPTVSSTFATQTDTSVELSSYDNTGDQLRLDLAPFPATTHSIRFDLAVINSDPTAAFTLHMDTPQIRNLSFMGDRTVRVFVPGGASQQIGTYARDTRIRVRIETNVTNDTLEVFLDGVSAFSGSFGGASQISALRFSTPVVVNPGQVRAQLDNIYVFGN